MKRPVLEMSQDAFEELHRRLDKARQGTKEVKVPTEALRLLLRDHSAIHAYIGDHP